MRKLSLLFVMPFIGLTPGLSTNVFAQQSQSTIEQKQHTDLFVQPWEQQTPLPLIFQQTRPDQIYHNPSYDNWGIIKAGSYASLIWRDPTSSLTLYITPSVNMISIDVIAKKKDNRALKLPYITWNIKDVSVVLNKVQDTKGWVDFSTAVYTENIDKLIKALEAQSPMTLNISRIDSIQISTNGLDVALSNLKDLIRQHNLTAPPSLGGIPTTTEPFVLLDGMLPSLFPLYQETNYYIQQCMTLASDKNKQNLRLQICNKRNTLLEKMKKQGWCWGSGDADQRDKDKNWRKCIFTPKGAIPYSKDQLQKDFENMRKDNTQ